MHTPETRFAKNGDVHIAYQVFGDGPIDLVLFGGTATHVELIWDEPRAARFLERLAGFSRVIMFDKRGVGMSDPVTGGGFPSLEERRDDAIAVLDAVRSDTAVLLGTSEGGPLAVMVAAADPSRVSGLLLFSTYARLARAPDYPEGATLEDFTKLLEIAEAHWGTTRGIAEITAPSLVDDETAMRWWATFVRRVISLGALLTQLRMNFETDVSHVLPLVQAPTVVMHGAGERFVSIRHARFMAEHIPGARFVEFPTSDHMMFMDAADLIADETEEFVTGTRVAAVPDRKLATVLISDVVGSTAKAASVGDERWRDLLERHDSAIRHQLARFRGQEVKHTGDGFLAVFDGPARAIRAGQAITAGVREAGLEARVGIHTGEVEVRGDDVSGIAVHIGARVAAQAGPGEVLVSQAVPPLVVGSGVDFSERGTYDLKGVPGRWQLFGVETGSGR